MYLWIMTSSLVVILVLLVNLTTLMVFSSLLFPCIIILGVAIAVIPVVIFTVIRYQIDHHCEGHGSYDSLGGPPTL